MTTYALCVMLVSVMICTSGQLVSGNSVCPTQDPNIAWGCAYQPHCFSDSGCGSGYKCCHHICGDYCYNMSTAVAATHSPGTGGDCHSLSCLFGDLIGHPG
ncbi:uncharacterized protein LOC117326738 [Pecten maximus]|uniref:uncharacterized protein LOC117326738 n=1 Tax=Pecten maximus TaxID=6579 RepID=UPI001457E775|nr:uncharacterized protein LOC117326738 [Pecten maximus]